jgi:hypothetical protein
MKGFLKTAGKPLDEDEEATGPPMPAYTSSKPKAEDQPAAAAASAAAESEGEEDDEQHEGPESRGHMLKRHKKVRSRPRGSTGVVAQSWTEAGWVGAWVGQQTGRVDADTDTDTDYRTR